MEGEQTVSGKDHDIAQPGARGKRMAGKGKGTASQESRRKFDSGENSKLFALGWLLKGRLHSRYLRPFLRPRWRHRPTFSFAQSRT
jgi:hypothetical protein